MIVVLLLDSGDFVVNQLKFFFVENCVKFSIIIAIFFLEGCKMRNVEFPEMKSFNLVLPLFNPHMQEFVCSIELDRVPPIDAEAESWFIEALSLDSREIFIKDRNYKKIVELTRQAAERHHWKAMLNLASYYLREKDPEHGKADAVRIVEKAMSLGIPAAYDRMGTFYKNGTGVNSDITKAYALWQRAAELGNPSSMEFLGGKLDAVWDDPDGGFWAICP